MDQLVREQLADAILVRGRGVVYQTALAEEMLKQQFASYPAQRDALILALREGVPAELLKPLAPPVGPRVDALARQLVESSGLTYDVARRTVETWAMALGVMSALESPLDPLGATLDKQRRAGSSEGDAIPKWTVSNAQMALPSAANHPSAPSPDPVWSGADARHASPSGEPGEQSRAAGFSLSIPTPPPVREPNLARLELPETGKKAAVSPPPATFDFSSPVPAPQVVVPPLPSGGAPPHPSILPGNAAVAPRRPSRAAWPAVGAFAVAAALVMHFWPKPLPATPNTNGAAASGGTPKTTGGSPAPGTNGTTTSTPDNSAQTNPTGGSSAPGTTGATTSGPDKSTQADPTGTSGQAADGTSGPPQSSDTTPSLPNQGTAIPQSPGHTNSPGNGTGSFTFQFPKKISFPTFKPPAEQKITESDLLGKSATEIKQMRNLPYAVHGYKFRDPELRKYFDRQLWYYPTYSDPSAVYAMFTSLERANVDTIEKYERRGTISARNFNHLPSPTSYQSLLLAVSARDLKSSELAELTAKEIRILRNTPYARHGYRFRDSGLATHFAAESWYHPWEGSEAAVESYMSPVERHNVVMIRTYQKLHGIK